MKAYQFGHISNYLFDLTYMANITTVQKLHPFRDTVHKPDLGRLGPRLGSQEAQQILIEHVW